MYIFFIMEEKKNESMEVINRKYIYETIFIEAGVFEAYCNQILNLNSGQCIRKNMILMKVGC